jgi:hypothetical protein
MPWKLPAPEAGTWEQPEPNGWVEPAAAALPEAEEEPAMELLSALVLLPEALPDDESEPQALSVTARVETAARRAPRVRTLLFTGWCSFRLLDRVVQMVRLCTTDRFSVSSR